MLLKKGDKVLIKKTSPCAGKGLSNPIGVEGKINRTSDGYYRVDWANGQNNVYMDSDLELVNIIPVVGNIILVDDMIDDGESVCEIIECDEDNEDGENYLIKVLYGNFSICDEWIDKKRVLDILSDKGVEQYLIDMGIKYKIGDIVNGQKVNGFDTEGYYYQLENGNWVERDIFESQKEEFINPVIEEINSLKALVEKLEKENKELKQLKVISLDEKIEQPKRKKLLF